MINNDRGVTAPITLFGHTFKLKRENGVILFVVFGVISVVMLVNASLMIYIGSTHSCEDWKPKLWMIIFGASDIWLAGIEILATLNKQDTDKSVFMTAKSLLDFAWLITGTVWVFDDSPCSNSILVYSRTMVIISWIITIILIIEWLFSIFKETTTPVTIRLSSA